MAELSMLDVYVLLVVGFSAGFLTAFFLTGWVKRL